MFKDHMDPDSPEMMFRELNRAHRTAMDAITRHYCIKECGQPIILFMLADLNEEGVAATQRSLAEMMRVTPSTIAVSLRSLEKLGCVRRIQDSRDARANRVEITDAGREMALKFKQAFDELEHAMYDGFTAEESGQMIGYLRRITENLDKFDVKAKYPSD